MNINRCELSGNITRDGELKATQGGTSVLSFGLAFNDRKRDAQTGEWEDVPNFIDCVIFGKYAESMERHITKGRRVFVAGKLKWSQWERGGNKRSKIELIVDTIDLPPTGQKKASQAAQQQAEQPTYSAPAPVEPDLYDDEIPF